MEQEELNEILNKLDNKAYSMVRSWLFNKANEFAVADNPDDAVRVHRVCNGLIPVIERVEPDYFIKFNQEP